MGSNIKHPTDASSKHTRGKRFVTVCIQFSGAFWYVFKFILTGVFQFLVGLFTKHSDSLTAQFGNEHKWLSTFNKGFNINGKSLTVKSSLDGVLVNGNTGSGKTSVSVMRSILKVQGSQIIHDPSGELYEKTSGYLHAQKYAILRLDLANASSPGQYNPLVRASSLSEINQVATHLVNFSAGKSQNDFWSQMAVQTLVCLIRTIKQLPSQYQNLYNVAFLLDCLQSKTMRDKVDQVVSLSSQNDTGLFEKYQALISNSDNTLSGILASATTALQLYSLDEKIARITSQDTLGDFARFRKKRTVLYIHSSTSNMAYYASLSSILLQQFFDHFFSQLPEQDAQTVFFHLDETPVLSLGHLDVISSNIRKYGGALMLICQDALNQLSAKYTRERATAILSNLRTHVYLGASGDQARSLEAQLGKYEYTDPQTEQNRIRPLLTADEIMCLSAQGQALITLGGYRPLLVNTQPYYKNFCTRKLTEYPAYKPLGDIGSEVIPPVLMNLDQIISNWDSNDSKQ